MEASDTQRALGTSEVLNILEFLSLTVAINSSGRPKSRQYLEWIAAGVQRA
jgi:hypothetical protein